MKFGIGVLGATGFIGTPYRQEIRESPDDAIIVALCARRRDLLQAAAKEDQARLVTTDWRQVVEHPEVNLVIIATPDALHREAVLACAQHGKHVFCEKPVAIHAREACEMSRAVQHAGLAHFVPFWTRYAPVYVRVRELVQQGLAGDVRAVIFRWHNPRPAGMPFTWRDDAQLSSAGSLADVGSHAYDTIRWLLGREATRVLAHADVITPAKPDLGSVNLAEALKWGQSPEIEKQVAVRQGTAFDYAAVAIEFDDGEFDKGEIDMGTVGTLVLSHAPYLRKGLAPEVELHGTKASLAVDRIKSTISIARPGAEVELLETVPDAGFGNRFAKHVFPALRSQIAGQPNADPNLEDGYRVQLFTDAAALSAKLGTWQTLAAVEASCR
jgi:predicted dehydrogenase